MASMISSENVRIVGGNFVQQIGIEESGVRIGQGLLARASSPNAFHNSLQVFDPPKCHEKTRVAVLDKIKNWILLQENLQYPIMWLHGGAGAGKTAIARTIAEWCQGQRYLISTFFFWRTDPTRNNAKSFVATLAYSVAQFSPAARMAIGLAVENDRHIFSLDLETQFSKLVHEPLEHISYSPPPHVMIVDGLDECCDEEDQVALLRLFASIFQRYRLPWKILVTSRKEQAISLVFEDHPWLGMTIPQILSNDYSADRDITLFLFDKFRDIKQKHPLKTQIPENWPDIEDVITLVAKSSGHFVFASMAIRYIQSRRYFPVDRLNLVIAACSPGSLADNALPFADLDRLFTHIFSSVNVDKAHLAPRLIGLIILMPRILGRSFQPSDCAHILTTVDVALILGELGSIVETDDDGSYKTLHASLEDYIFDQRRARQFWVDQNLVYIDLLYTTKKVERHWASLNGLYETILRRIKLNQESCEYFVGLIDFGSMADILEDCIFSRESNGFIFQYLEYLKSKVSEFDAGKHYRQQLSIIFDWVATHYTHVMWEGLLHFISEVDLHTCQEICARSISPNCNNPPIPYCSKCDKIFDETVVQEFASLLQLHFDNHSSRETHIASASTALIKFLCKRRRPYEVISLRPQRTPSRWSRPWLWKVRTSRQRFQVERRGMWKKLAVRRRFHTATVPYTKERFMEWNIYYNNWLHRWEEDSRFRKTATKYSRVWNVPQTLLVDVVSEVHSRNPLESYWKSYTRILPSKFYNSSWSRLGYWPKIQIGSHAAEVGFHTREALLAVPKMLQLSQKTPELVKLVSSDLILPPIAYVFSKEVHAVRRAVDCFLNQDSLFQLAIRIRRQNCRLSKTAE